MTSPVNGLVLGAATGFKPEALQVFLNSLDNTGYKGATVLLVHDTDRDLAAWLQSRGVRVFSLPATQQINPTAFPSPKRLSQTGRYLPRFLRRRLIDPLALQRLHICYARFLHFNLYLQRHRREFSHVFLTDTRDVVFQANPLTALQNFGHDLCFFLENTGIPIEKEPFNRGTVLSVYGPDGLEKIGHQPVICSGTVGGGTSQVLAFLDCLSRQILRRLKILYKCSYGDQAVHNWAAWTGKLPPHRKLPNFQGPVATLATADSSRFQFNADGLLLNDDRSIIPVLHQYDRHPELHDLVQKLAQATP